MKERKKKAHGKSEKQKWRKIRHYLLCKKIKKFKIFNFLFLVTCRGILDILF